MRKNVGLALVCGALLSVASAHAADLAPPPVIPPPPGWTGFYLGLNIGGTWGASNGVNAAATDFFDDPLWLPGAVFAASASGSIPDAGVSGVIGGGQIGYNYQFSPSFVAGLEADGQGVSGAGHGQSSGLAYNLLFQDIGVADAAVVTNSEVTKKLNYFGTVRGRIGYLVTPTLLAYATGGLAYGGVRLSASQTSYEASGFYGPGFGAASFSGSRAGWTVGGGLEWQFMPGWSLKGEYLYYDLGSVTTNLGPVAGQGFTFNLPPGSIGWAYGTSLSTRFNGNVFRVGLNYHF